MTQGTGCSSRTSQMDDYFNLVSDASTLLVGAGGIGCEVIKNLLLCGVQKLVIVDLDTIDISNLNRQFLYHREHVSMHKSVVACQKAKEVAPTADITAKVCNILEWKPHDVAMYDVVLSALDNVNARSHLNYCCITAGVPLIESGSSGLNGQVYPILKGITKCYACQEKPRPKSIPVCTIRQIPEKSEHCIAWARMLYELLFGSPDEENVLNDLEIAKVPKDGTITKGEACRWVKQAFEYLFKKQIADIMELRKDWPEGKVPCVIDYPLGEDGSHTVKGNDEELGGSKIRKVTIHHKGEMKHVGIKEKMKICSVEELATQFRDSILHMMLRDWEIIGKATFDKDDPICIKFIAAAANLRMINFHIPQLNAWDVQSIAGSIVPAIASTNAIVAAMQVMQMIQVLRAKRYGGGIINKESFDKSDCRFVWVKGTVTGSRPLIRGALCSPEQLEAPNPRCVICQQQCAKMKISNLEHWTLQQVVERVFRGHMGIEAASIDFGNRNIYDSEYLEEDETYASKAREKPLSEYGIENGSIMTVTCLSSGKQLDIQLVLQESLDEGEFCVVDCTP